MLKSTEKFFEALMADALVLACEEQQLVDVLLPRDVFVGWQGNGESPCVDFPAQDDLDLGRGPFCHCLVQRQHVISWQ